MLKSSSHLKDLTIHASDGDIGSVEDLYFDDATWTVRYLIANTGDWLSGRRILISPAFLRNVDWGTKRLHVAMTMKQIEHSPDIDTRRPVSRQHEAEYLDYFGSSYYWGGSYLWGAGLFPGDMVGAVIPTLTKAPLVEEVPADTHLRSASSVVGHRIHAADGDVGHVEDFIVDPDTWSIRYLEVDTRNWLPGKKVLVSPQWIRAVSWAESSVSIDLPQDAIKDAPEYNEEVPLDRNYENRLHEYYGRLGYWHGETGKVGTAL